MPTEVASRVARPGTDHARPSIAAWAWAKSQLRHRLVPLVVAGLLIGVAGAATVGAVAGARRASTVYERAQVEVDAPQVGLGPDLDPKYFVPGTLDPYYRIDGVETYTEALVLAMRPVGSDFYFVTDRTAAAALDDRLGTEVDRFRIVDGRAYDHRRDDEVVLSEDYAEAVGAAVGDVMTFESWSPAAVQEALASNFHIGPPDGPVVEVTVVGVARELDPFWVGQSFPGTAYFPVGFTRKWAPSIGAGYLLGEVRLDDGFAGLESYRDAAMAVSDEVGVGLRITAFGQAGTQAAGAIDAQVLALQVFAVVVGAAGTVLAYAVLSRQLSFAADDQPALTALGMTRRARALAVTMLAGPTAVVAAAAAVVLAFLSSALLPISTPGLIEPQPGLRADLVVLLAGAAGMLVIVMSLAVVVGVSVTRRVSRAPVAARAPGVASTIAGWSPSSPAMAIGVRQAFEHGRGARALPTRSTLIGCAVGLTGVVAALSFAASLDHLLSTPRLYGFAPDAVAFPDNDEWRPTAQRLDADPDIAEVATIISTTLVVDGRSFGAVVYDPIKGDPFSVIISGRAPRAGNELVVGARVADELGVGPGSRVSVALADGSPGPYEVVGIGVHPNDFDTFRSQIALLGDSTDPFLTGDEAPGLGVLVRFTSDVDVDSVTDAYRAEGIELYEGGPPPSAVSNLGEVRSFPSVLAALLGLLAIVFLHHALTVGARRRRRDLAVLRTIGFTSRQLRAVATWQATAIAVVGLVVAVPAGLAVGRVAWARLTGNLGVVTEYRLSIWPILLVFVVLAVANGLALIAGNRAVRVRPAVELRAGRRE